ncbi:hypothetical protein JCM3765_007208 [Sporobolomyces pararoseus]
MTSLRTLVSSSRSLFVGGVRSFSTTSTRTASSSLPPPLPHHTDPSTLTPPSKLAETCSVPDEISAISLLKTQPAHYVSALLMGRRYLLTKDDILTVPYLKSVPVGSKIQLTRILEVGSRDYTLRAASTSSPSNNLSRPPILTQSQSESITIPRDWQRHPDSLPYLSNRLVSAELIVVEHTKGEMFQIDKFKRRKGYRRSLRSKLGFTKLRMGEIKLLG